MQKVVSIGDGIVDAVELTPGNVERFPGGAALNLAVGIARLGFNSQFVTRFGQDQNGALLQRYLREEGVTVFNSPNVDFTGVAYSTRKNGEPTYRFTPSMFRRRIAFTDTVRAAIAAADAVVVNSFPFDNPRQAMALVEALRQARGLVVVDPNPRPNLISDIDAYRSGAERAMAMAGLVKLSDEDAALFYGEQPDAVARRLFDMGAGPVLLTHGSEGASVFPKASPKTSSRVSVPIADSEGPVVDTMGAGDATLATVIGFILRHGMPMHEADWRACLQEAMRVGAATCASPGGSLVLPAGYPTAH